MKVIIFFTGILGTAFMSCKKDDNKPGCVANAASIAGTYKTTAVKYKANSSAAEQDFFAALDACEKDDLIKLNVDGTADYQDIGAVCTPSGTSSSTWALNGNTITMNGTSGTIQLFDCKKLVVKSSGVLVAGDMLTATYEKQ